MSRKQKHIEMWEGIIKELETYSSYEELCEKNKECFEDLIRIKDGMTYYLLQKLKAPYWKEDPKDPLKCYACKEMFERLGLTEEEKILFTENVHEGLDPLEVCKKGCPLIKNILHSCMDSPAHRGAFQDFSNSTNLNRIIESAKIIKDGWE